MAGVSSAVPFGMLAVVLVVAAKGKRPLEKLAVGLCTTALLALAVVKFLGTASNGVLVVGIVGLCLCSLAGGIVVALRIQDSNRLFPATGPGTSE